MSFSMCLIKKMDQMVWTSIPQASQFPKNMRWLWIPDNLPFTMFNSSSYSKYTKSGTEAHRIIPRSEFSILISQVTNIILHIKDNFHQFLMTLFSFYNRLCYLFFFFFEDEKYIEFCRFSSHAWLFPVLYLWN